MAVASSRSSAASTTADAIQRQSDAGGIEPLVPRAPQMRRLGGPQRLRDEALAGGQRRRRRADGLHALALDAETHQQLRQNGLRMAGMTALAARHVIGRGGDGGPALGVEIEIQPGQHHRAARQAGDGGEQRGGGRHRAGRAGCDDRARAAGRAGAAPPRRAGACGGAARRPSRHPRRKQPATARPRSPGRRAKCPSTGCTARARACGCRPRSGRGSRANR